VILIGVGYVIVVSVVVSTSVIRTCDVVPKINLETTKIY
jgi:hypothetical protein